MADTPLLILFVGIPGSGKTTFARQLAKKLNAVVLNSDGIRMAMWRSLDAIQATHASKEERVHGNLLTFGAMNYAAEQVISTGYSVVYDCNANSVAERAEKHNIASKHNALSIIVRLRVPYETSLQRIQEREIAHDQRRISPEKAESVLERFTGEIEEPTTTEQVIEISGSVSFEEQYAIFHKSLKGFLNEQAE